MASMSVTITSLRISRCFATAVVKPHVPMIKFRKGQSPIISDSQAPVTPQTEAVAGKELLKFITELIFFNLNQIQLLVCMNGGRFLEDSREDPLTKQSVMSLTWEVGTNFGDNFSMWFKSKSKCCCEKIYKSMYFFLKTVGL